MNRGPTSPPNWPMRMRALSFVITLGVVMLECAVVAIPFGLGFAIAGRFSQHLLVLLLEVSAPISLGVAVYAHRRQRTALTVKME